MQEVLKKKEKNSEKFFSFSLKLLDDNEIYLGTQVECEWGDGSIMKFFGLVAGMDFLLVGEYGANYAIVSGRA